MGCKIPVIIDGKVVHFGGGEPLPASQSCEFCLVEDRAENVRVLAAWLARLNSNIEILEEDPFFDLDRMEKLLRIRAFVKLALIRASDLDPALS